jgi:enediyne biosynthesis thioesterase
MMKAYEYKHTVGFEETNLVGNVYYANFVRWQGRCREMFLRDYTPDILPKLGNGFAMVTTKVSCEYFSELTAFDEIVIKMRLGSLKQNRILMFFEYWRGGQLVARGEQEVACMMRNGEAFKPAAIPENLQTALRDYL